MLATTLDCCVAELPRRQFGALGLRELVDYDICSVDSELISQVLDLTEGTSFSAHTSAYEEAKRTIKRKLVDKLGEDSLAELLSDLDINLRVARPVDA